MNYKEDIMKKKNFKMKVNNEIGTSWITTKGTTWSRNKYPKECIDRFGDVWLKPYMDTPNLYATVDGPELYFHIKDGSLEEN